jgi:hypothetical protein
MHLMFLSAIDAVAAILEEGAGEAIRYFQQQFRESDQS